MMIDLSVIILTFNEQIHIERCLKQFQGLDIDIVIVDSFSSDDTLNIARSFGVRVFENKFVSQSQQFEWSLANCNIDNNWILRVDADEIFGRDLLKSIVEFTENDGFGFNGAYFERKHFFLGRWIKHGGRFPVRILRLFKKGTAHVEQKWMDEHIVLDHGNSTVLKGDFSDINLNSVSWFIEKHNKYATREVVDLISNELFNVKHEISQGTGFFIRLRRFMKDHIYMRFPPFFRPTFYFLYRYLLQLGFLDGREGFAYHFMQGFWYRCLVDLKLLEVRRLMIESFTLDEKIKVLEDYSGYKLRK